MTKAQLLDLIHLSPNQRVQITFEKVDGTERTLTCVPPQIDFTSEAKKGYDNRKNGNADCLKHLVVWSEDDRYFRTIIIEKIKDVVLL